MFNSMEGSVDLVQQLDELASKGGELSSYECLVALLSNLSPTELKNVVGQCNTIKLFNSMDLHNSNHMEVALRLATIMFSVIPLPELFAKHPTEVLQALQTDRQELVVFVLKKMAVEIAIQGDGQFSAIKQCGLLKPVINGLLERDPLVNLNYIELAKKLIFVPVGYDWFEQTNLSDKLLARMMEFKNDTLGHLLLPGYMQFFGCLARANPAYWIGDKNANPAKTLISTLVEALDNSDPTISLTAIDTIGHIAGGRDGRAVLMSYLANSGPLVTMWTKLNRYLEDSTSAICVRALECTAELLGQSNDMTLLPISILINQAQITFDWAAHVSLRRAETMPSDESARSTIAARLLVRLTKLATNPFMDVRLAALKAVQALSTQPWGVSLMLEQAGCMEYFLNRRTEAGLADVTQLMQAKYEIVKSIVLTAQVYPASVLDQETSNPLCFSLQPEQMTCLRAYIKEGMWGVRPAEAAIAMEPA